jgi:phospholipase D1/2
VSWLRIGAVVVLCGLMLAAWKWLPRTTANLEEIAAWLTAHRHTWYALPAVMLAFVVLGLAMVPVILLIAATGIAFGPLLGPAYAMAGCLASASTGFAIGRWMGLQRITQFGGQRIIRVTHALKRNGTLAVFLVRKIPAPFTLVNIIVGASTVRFRDFIIGTVLGMGAFVVGLAGFGYQAASAVRNPSAGTLIGAAMFVLVPLMLAVMINRTFRRMSRAE